VIGEPLTIFGAVTLSVLLLRFLRAEEADANDLVLSPRILATRGTALL
jgi:hypothetical protein